MADTLILQFQFFLLATILRTNFIISSLLVPGPKTSATPILVHFENMKQRLHTDKTFELSSIDNKIQLKGPELAEATYPQQLGM